MLIMKHTANYIILTAAGLLCACQKSEVCVPECGAEMNFILSQSGVKTKVAGSAFEEGDQAGLYITDYVDDSNPCPLQISGNRANNLRIVSDGAAWTPDRTVYWGEGKSDVYAYYPYIEDITDVNAQPFTVTSYEASDFLWAKAEGVRREGGAVCLPMKHIMSKLTVRIVAGEDYVGSLPEDATVLLHSTVTAAKIDLESGSAVKDPYGSARSVSMKNLGIRDYDGVKAVVYEAIVVPQMLETSVPLIEINSKSVSYLLEDSFNFRSGVAYAYTVTLNTSTTAIKVDIGCEIDDWNSTGGPDSGSGDEGGDESGDESDDDGVEYTDLSAAGTANCYLVTGAGDYKFKAVQGNTDGTVGNVKSVEVLWESFGTDEQPNVGDLIAKASYKNGYIRFSTPSEFRQGNAVIASKNSKGVILWSWHIWLSSEGWKEQVYYNDAGTMMDRNLGALSATPGDVLANGLFYQWGRKDPFLGASSIDSNTQALSTGTWTVSSDYMTYVLAEANSMTFYLKGQYCSNWAAVKNAYDPCPAGWRVPDGGAEDVWVKAFGNMDSYKTKYNANGLDFTGVFGSDESIWYPLTGFFTSHGSLSNNKDYCYNAGNLVLVGKSVQYWSSSRYDYEFGYCLGLSTSKGYLLDGYPVRCCKE